MLCHKNTHPSLSHTCPSSNTSVSTHLPPSPHNNTPVPHLPIPSPYPSSFPNLLPPHPLELLNNQEIRIQKAIHTVPRARLLTLIQLAALDAAGHALGPADVCEVVDGWVFN